MSEFDASKGDWIRVAQEWMLLNGERPETRVECQYGGYGCDTGCMGYRLYIVRGDEEIEQGSFEFGLDGILERAEKLATALGLPLVVDRDRDW